MTMTSTVSMDLLAYYERHNITDFPKRTNGTPDMRKGFNKRHHASLRLFHITSPPIEVQSKSQMECPVCYEKLEKGKGKVVLGCDHTFCIDCFTKFMHQKNTCPMCRDPFTQRSFQPLEDDHIDDMVNSIISMNIWKIDNHSSGEDVSPLDTTQMVNYHLSHMSPHNMENTVDLIVSAMEHQCSMVASCARNYFESQFFR